VVAWK
jgi:hypothetical protein